jgi:predicted component of type VI protein secretion system
MQVDRHAVVATGADPHGCEAAGQRVIEAGPRRAPSEAADRQAKRLRGLLAADVAAHHVDRHDPIAVAELERQRGQHVAVIQRRVPERAVAGRPPGGAVLRPWAVSPSPAGAGSK